MYGGVKAGRLAEKRDEITHHLRERGEQDLAELALPVDRA